MVSNKLHMYVFSQRVEGRNLCRHKENMQQTQQQHRKAESEATTFLVWSVSANHSTEDL